MATTFIFTSEKRETINGWSRNVRIGDQEYACSVTQGKRVRIAYKPKGKNIGFQWWGAVYRIGANSGRVWQDRVPGSIGVRGLLQAAGLINGDKEAA